MGAFRPLGGNGSNVPGSFIGKGDTLVLGEALTAGAIATIGDGVWTAAAIASGIITRTGPTGAFADVTDSAQNILNALAGNGTAEVENGSSFRLLVINTVAFADTVTGGTGVTLGTGGSGVTNIAASKAREYLVRVQNASPTVVLQSVTATNKLITFVLPPGMVAFPIGNAPNAINITPGMLVAGTNITAGTLVDGITMGQGGIIGVHVDTDTTGSGTVSLTFSPRVLLDGLRSDTL